MKTTLLTLLSAIVLAVGCGKEPEPLHIACSADLMPVVSELGREFKSNFGISVSATIVHSDDFTVEKPPAFDFILTDDLDLVAQLRERGTITMATNFACTMPVAVLRRSDRLPVLKLADLPAVDSPLRMTIASSGETLPRIVKARFGQIGLPFHGDGANIRLMPFLIREIRSDGTQQRTTAKEMLQQLTDQETDLAVFWDFVAADALANRADAFVTMTWPQESADTITIPLCLAKDCTKFSDCKVFIDFVKSRRGSELLQSCFLIPYDDIIEVR
ncbi:MAG: substrate-binding domain-containing protein [Planctomycetaceae bacterium]|nr:substrate-binding domain-containing protein [Planctomycetaceae bacterium]